MSGESVKMELKDMVCVLTLNRPEKRNAMDEDVRAEFLETVQRLKNEPRARVAVITGAGDAFSAGGNLRGMLERAKTPLAANRKSILSFYETFLTVMDLEIPTIAAINGPAIGAGACLCMACDMRYAASNAKIGFTFVKIGLHPGMGAEYFLTRAVGTARAFELLMTGDVISAEEACRIGLINQVVPPGELMDRVMEVAGKIASMPALPVKMLKQSIPVAARSDLDDVLQMEATYQAMCYMGSDIKEGILAMIEKRSPRFSDEY
jgi:enoyl-CoA hydratase/carnithine racemase